MSPTIMSGLKPSSRMRVGAAVDADEHRADVADVGAQRAQVALVVDAAHDDQRRAVAEVGVEARQLDLARRAARAPRRMCSTVLRGEGLERLADLAPALVVARAHGPGSWTLAGGEELAVAPDLAAAHARSRRRP